MTVALINRNPILLWRIDAGAVPIWRVRLQLKGIGGGLISLISYRLTRGMSCIELLWGRVHNFVRATLAFQGFHSLKPTSLAYLGITMCLVRFTHSTRAQSFTTLSRVLTNVAKLRSLSAMPSVPKTGLTDLAEKGLPAVTNSSDFFVFGLCLSWDYFKP